MRSWTHPAIPALVCALVTPAAYGHGGDPNVLHACIHRASGQIRAVAPDEACRTPESPVHLSMQSGAASGGARGVALFEGHGSFTVPAGVTSVVVEMWGAGGAAGFAGLSGIGGPGGGGAYLRTGVAVNPGQVVTVTVGAGGTAACGVDGGAGGDTTFGSLAAAGGGQGGTAAGLAGAGGSAGQGGISVDGTIGLATGGFSAQGTFAAPARRAPGRGGVSSAVCTLDTLGAATGSPGQLIVHW